MRPDNEHNILFLHHAAAADVEEATMEFKARYFATLADLPHRVLHLHGAVLEQRSFNINALQRWDGLMARAWVFGGRVYYVCIGDRSAGVSSITRDRGLLECLVRLYMVGTVLYVVGNVHRRQRVQPTSKIMLSSHTESRR